jgi:hypothetical protein
MDTQVSKVCVPNPHKSPPLKEMVQKKCIASNMLTTNITYIIDSKIIG